MLEKYETINIVKVSDFGLVKIPDSHLTSITTELKGYFNDPSLSTDGFDTYNLLHETYALTRLIFFIITGKTNTSNIENNDLKRFVHRGINVDLTQRYKDVGELLNAFNEIKEE